VKDMHSLLSPFIVTLFNKSLASGCFLAAFKLAVIRPFIIKEEWT